MKKTHHPVLFLELKISESIQPNSKVYRKFNDLTFSSLSSNTVYVFDSICNPDQSLNVSATFDKFVEVIAAAFVHDRQLIESVHIMSFSSLEEAHALNPSIYVNLAALSKNTPSARIQKHINQLQINPALNNKS